MTTTMAMNPFTSSVYINDQFNRRNNGLRLSLNDNKLLCSTSGNNNGEASNSKVATPSTTFPKPVATISQPDHALATEKPQPASTISIPVSDSMLLQDLMPHLFSFDENPDLLIRNINIVSTCSSLGSAYSNVVPQILSHYLYLAKTNPALSKMKNVTANVVHVIPQHKTIKSQVRTQQRAGSDRNSVPSLGSFSSIVPSNMNLTTNFPISPDGNSSNSLNYFSFNSANSACNHKHSESENYYSSPHHLSTNFHLQHSESYSENTYSNYSCSPKTASAKKHSMISDTLFNDEFTKVTLSSPSLSQSPPSPSLTPLFSLFQNQHQSSQAALLSEEQMNIIQDKIFNTFAFMPSKTNALVVPPNSTQFNFALYPLLLHTLPSFSDIIQARFKETSPSGLMVVCYPTSRSLYTKNIMPCLDLALHQMLALNLISTQACEAITVPPNAPIYSYDEQRTMIEGLENAEIVYSRDIKNYCPSDWGLRWISEDIVWMRETLQDLDVSSQSIIELISMMTKNPLWDRAGSCEISLFIVKKLDVEWLCSILKIHKRSHFVIIDFTYILKHSGAFISKLIYYSTLLFWIEFFYFF